MKKLPVGTLVRIKTQEELLKQGLYIISDSLYKDYKLHDNTVGDWICFSMLKNLGTITTIKSSEKLITDEYRYYLDDTGFHYYNSWFIDLNSKASKLLFISEKRK